MAIRGFLSFTLLLFVPDEPVPSDVPFEPVLPLVSVALVSPVVPSLIVEPLVSVVLFVLVSLVVSVSPEVPVPPVVLVLLSVLVVLSSPSDLLSSSSDFDSSSTSLSSLNLSDDILFHQLLSDVFGYLAVPVAHVVFRIVLEQSLSFPPRTVYIDASTHLRCQLVGKGILYAF